MFSDFPAKVAPDGALYDDDFTGRFTKLGTTSASVGCSFQQPAESMPDVVQLVSRRYLQWQQYCGMRTVASDAFPIAFSSVDAHCLSLADLFAMSKPGDLFAYE